MTVAPNKNTQDLKESVIEKKLRKLHREQIILTDWLRFQLPLLARRVQEPTASTRTGSGFRRIPDTSSKLQP
jgi:hypothetical protein